MIHDHSAGGTNLVEMRPIAMLKRLAHGIGTALNQMHNAQGVDHDGSSRVGSDIVLNGSFVEEVGREKAVEFCAVLDQVGRMTHLDRDEIQVELTRRLDTIGVALSPVEFERFVDEVARSDWVHARISGPPTP